MNWYRIDSKEIFLKINTFEEGLTDKEARERLTKYGPNKLAEEEKINKLKILLHQFTSPLIYILLLAAIVTFILKEYIDKVSLCLLCSSMRLSGTSRSSRQKKV